MKQSIGMPFDYEYEWGEEPNIFYIQPYAVDMYYGKQINKHIEMMPDDAWIVLTDYDSMFLSPGYGRIIHNAIVEHGNDTDLFTCWTNRLGNAKRCFAGTFSTDFDIRNHARLARSLEREPGHECKEVEDRTVAGVCMIFSKRVWQDNKFDDLPIIAKVADHHSESFDVRWCKKIKGSIKRIEGLYMFHFYRGDKPHHSITTHLEI